MPVTVTDITEAERSKLLGIEENHFADVKAKAISPAKLTKTIAAFSNAEGGELYIGIGQDALRRNFWAGFDDPESANGHLQAFEALFPLGEGYAYTFLRSEGSPGLVLKVDIAKSRDVKKASDGRVYVRRGAQSLPVETEDALARLRRNKGLTSFETEPVNVGVEVITNSTVTLEFMLQVVPTGEPEPWLRKQQAIQGDKPTVAGLILFAEEPQAALPKRSGIKIYRYRTTADEGTRDTLDGDPLSIEGHAYDQIKNAVRIKARRCERIRVNGSRRDLLSGFGRRESLVSSSRRSRPSRNHPDRTARRAQGRAASARRSGPLRASTVLLSAGMPTGGFGG